MSNWNTLDQFDAQLRKDSTFRTKLDEAEPDYRLGREIVVGRLAAKTGGVGTRVGTSHSRPSE